MSEAEITTTASAGATHYVSVVGPQLPLPSPRLFDVEVDGLMGYSLIPLTDLARDLAAAWLHGPHKLTLEGVSQYPKTRMLVKRLRVVSDVGPLLTGGGDPFLTGQSVTKEERAIALAAIEGYREANRAKLTITKRGKLAMKKRAAR